MPKNLQAKAASICNRLFSLYWIKWVHLDVLHIFFYKDPFNDTFAYAWLRLYFFPLYPLVEKRDLVKSLDITTLNTEDIEHAVIDSRRISDWKTATFKAVFASHWKLDKKCHVFNMIKRILFYFLKHTFI